MPFTGCAKCASNGVKNSEGSARFSFGIYAGRYCDAHWKTSGYRDATDDEAVFSPEDAGERLEPEDEFGITDREDF